MKFHEWKELLTEWAKTGEHRGKVNYARKVIETALKKYNKPYVAFSGGKDSTCVLALILEQKPDIMVLNWDYGEYFMPRDFQNEIIENAKKMGAVNIRVETSKKYEELKDQAVNVLGEEYLGKLLKKLKKEGYDLAFTGLRAEEAVKRKLKTKKFFYKENGLMNCAPIRNWTWKDVWAFIFSNNLPYHSHYERYADVEGIESVRLCTFFDKEFDKFGRTNIDGVVLWKKRGAR